MSGNTVVYVQPTSSDVIFEIATVFGILCVLLISFLIMNITNIWGDLIKISEEKQCPPQTQSKDISAIENRNESDDLHASAILKIRFMEVRYITKLHIT